MRKPNPAEIQTMKDTEALLEIGRLKCRDTIVLLEETLHPLGEKWADSNVELFFPYARINFWLHTTLKFNQVNDFQAAAAAARSIFEIAVDTTLIQLGGQDADRIGAWERSAKFKAAEKIAHEYGEDPEAVPHLVRPFIELFLQEKDVIGDFRREWWKPAKKTGAGRHPSRWTGGDLKSDVDLANELYPEALFARWYLWAYSYRCVAMHGSGSGGMRGAQAFEGGLNTAKALMESAHFALVVAEMIADLWGTEHNQKIREYRTNEIILGHLITDPPTPEEKIEVERIATALRDAGQ